MVLLIYARFIYRAEKRSDQWKVARFDCIYLRDELAPANPDWSIAIDPKKLREIRTSYRLLPYGLEQSGYRIRSDLPGEDKPETVRTLMREIHAWKGKNSG